MSEIVQSRYAARSGQRVGDLVFRSIVRVDASDGNRAIGEFECSCGRVVTMPAGRVLNGKARTHCGCLADPHAPKTHGMRYSREYSSWQSMKARCLDPDNKDYPKWGGRGVTIFPDWISSFEAFFAHIGSRPPGTTLDRIDGTRGYEPGNVRWATPTEQAQNTSAGYVWHVKGHVFQSLSEAAAHFKVSEHAVWRWVNGQFDKRRGNFTKALENCYVVSRY